MRKDIHVTIVQQPVSAIFTCTHCDIEFEIEYKKFENMVNGDLTGILYDNISFECPECGHMLIIGEAELD